MAFALLDDYATPDRGTAAAAPAGGMTLMNLSTMTLVDAGGVFDAGSSTLGETSTIVAALNHGTINDSGVDPALWTLDIGARPASATALALRLDLGTFPTQDPGSSHCILSIGVKPPGTLTASNGYYAGFLQTNSANTTARSVARVGSGGSTSATITGTPGRCDLFVGFDDTTADGASNWTRGNTTIYQDANISVASLGTYTTVEVLIALSNGGSPPTGAPNWGGVKAWYGWIDPS